MNTQQFIKTLSKLRPSSTFLTLKGYSNEHGEVADYSIVFHISYRSALERSILMLESLVPENDLEAQAKNELLLSYNNSLNKIEDFSIEEMEDNTYSHFKDENGNYIKGIKLHNTTDILHLYGLVANKRILIPGDYKEVKSRPLTLAKNKLKKNLPVNRFRQFKILPSQVEEINVENLNFLIEEK
jgi:hypothetical protein